MRTYSFKFFKKILEKAMAWVFYSLLAAMLWAIVNVTDKYTMSKLVETPIVPLLILAIMGLFVAGMINGIYSFESLTLFNLGLVFLAGLFYVLTMLFYYLALKHEEVSKVIPIYYLSPVFILFFARGMLGEHLTFYQYFGIIFLVSGAVLISVESSLKFKVGKGLWYILLAAFCYALNQVLTKYLLKYNEFWSIFSYIRIGIFLSLIPAFCWNFSKIINSCKKINLRAYGIMSINQLFNIMGVFAITLAMTSGYVTVVNALASVQPFFVLVITLILGFFLPSVLKERLEGEVLIRKLMATVFIMIGVLILS
jgi:bacterial/archaeal transporter family protein